VLIQSRLEGTGAPPRLLQDKQLQPRDFLPEAALPLLPHGGGQAHPPSSLVQDLPSISSGQLPHKLLPQQDEGIFNSQTNLILQNDHRSSGQRADNHLGRPFIRQFSTPSDRPGAAEDTPATLATSTAVASTTTATATTWYEPESRKFCSPGPPSSFFFIRS